ncbi:MAG: NAD(P)H-hydrate dehydratase [Eubacteriales bacterium]
MQYYVTQHQMQAIEQDTITNTGIPSLVLMERAALAVADVVEEYIHDQKLVEKEVIQILCGKGNNGADGIAIGRLLTQRGYLVSIITIGDPTKATKEYIIQEDIARKLEIPLISWQEWQPNPNGCIVDGIFGIGLTREITGEYKELIKMVQVHACSHIIAIDVPSGIHANTGSVLGCAIKVAVTVTFAYGKVGLILGQGKEYAGKVIIAQIGLDENSIVRVGYTGKVLEEIDLTQIPQRREDANKGTYGKLLMIAGSKGMSGAAYLCAKAAYRMGAGLVKLLTVEENRAILQMQLPEAIVVTYHESNLGVVLAQECQWATTVLIGSGIGQDSYVRQLVEITMKLCGNRIPMVLDSDALNTIAHDKQLEQLYSKNMVITPHMKEMSRLRKQEVDVIKSDAVAMCKDYSTKHGITCLLKDSTSVITNEIGETYLNLSGNSALAKAGTGDVLAGMVAGLLCLGMSPIKAAAFASYLHGKAGVKQSMLHGKHGVMAGDLLE